MATKLIIDGNAVYEIDEDCLECQKRKSGCLKWPGPENGDEEWIKTKIRNTDKQITS